MGIVSYGGNVELWKTDKEIFNIAKVRNHWTCCKCRKKLPIGSYCWGRGWYKYCIDCGLVVCDNMNVQLKDFSKYIAKQKKDCEKNKDKYYTNNALVNL